MVNILIAVRYFVLLIVTAFKRALSPFLPSSLPLSLSLSLSLILSLCEITSISRDEDKDIFVVTWSVIQYKEQILKCGSDPDLHLCTDKPNVHDSVTVA